MAKQRENGISWTDDTWNPIVGCSIVSPACTNCYAMAQAARIERMASGSLNAIAVHERLREPSHYAGLTQPSKAGPVWTGKVALAPDHILTAPLRWKRPRRIFVNSMGDLFHESVPDEWIDRVFAVMALAPQHTFQVLTKRADRMREYISGQQFKVPILGGKPLERVHFAAMADEDHCDYPFWEKLKEHGNLYSLYCSVPWPLPNVWLGVTAEDEPRWLERVPYLRTTPAARRFVSYEPALGSVANCDLDGLDWIIAGGESGPNARPSHPDWLRSLRDQCAAAGVPYFFKQWGEWIDANQWFATLRAAGPFQLICNGEPVRCPPSLNFEDAQGLADATGASRCEHQPDGSTMLRVGKRRAGSLLDGREHKEFPA